MDWIFNLSALALLSLAIGIIVLVVALVVWLAELMGSVIYPCLLLGLLLALLTYIIYKVSQTYKRRAVDNR